MNKYPTLRDIRDIDKEDYDVCEGLGENDLEREKERVKAFFLKRFSCIAGSTVTGWGGN